MQKRKSNINRSYLTFLAVWVLFSQTSFNALAQTESLYFERNQIKWVLFTDSNEVGFNASTAMAKTLEQEEIITADSLIYDFLKSKFSNGQYPQQGINSCPYILDSWDRYYRQVVVVRENGTSEDIIWIQYIHKNVVEDHQNWKESWVYISGGCSNYWQAQVGVDSKKVISFRIN